MTQPASQPAVVGLLLNDLYELTMAQAYFVEGIGDAAVFELLFREMPPQRNYVVAAGLDDVLEFLESAALSDEQIAYLRGLGRFRDDFLDYLRRFRFRGDVWAVPEGTPVFPNEPIARVAAPILEAQLVETAVLNRFHVHSVLASKAARIVQAAAGRSVVDFGLRRAHGVDAGLAAARSSYLAGFAGTSNMLAGRQYGIPVFGTMAHSYVQAHGDEREAFRRFAAIYPATTLLVDTYDTLRGVRQVIELSRELGDRFQVAAIRLDSGDLLTQARQARQMLDEAGLAQVRIFASGGLEEKAIARLVAADAPIDGFGVGTRFVVAEDAASLDLAYKLVEFGGRPRMKLSAGKMIHPGRKQVFRHSAGGRIVRDVVALEGETAAGEPLLKPVMQGGRRLPAGDVPLEAAREYCRRRREELPPALRSLEPAHPPFEVALSDRLRRQSDALRARLSADQSEGGGADAPA